jgi:hypothetical protein
MLASAPVVGALNAGMMRGADDDRLDLRQAAREPR